MPDRAEQTLALPQRNTRATCCPLSFAPFTARRVHDVYSWHGRWPTLFTLAHLVCEPCRLSAHDFTDNSIVTVNHNGHRAASLNIFISGGARGIGRGLGRLLLLPSHRVFVADNSRKELDQRPVHVRQADSHMISGGARTRIFVTPEISSRLLRKLSLIATATSTY